MRVYLSKSNLSDPYLVDRVRVTLLDAGYIVHEHHGGNYDVEHMLECQAVIMIPNSSHITLNSQILNAFSISLGKGQSDQLNAFESYMTYRYPDMPLPLFFIEEVGNDCIYVSTHCGYTPCSNPDWKTRYCNIDISGDCNNVLITLNQVKADWDRYYPQTKKLKADIEDYTIITFTDNVGQAFNLNVNPADEKFPYKCESLDGKIHVCSLNWSLDNLFIHSVRRNSTGDVFALNQLVNKGKITQFIKVNDLIRVRIYLDLYDIDEIMPLSENVNTPPFHTHDFEKGIYSIHLACRRLFNR